MLIVLLVGKTVQMLKSNKSMIRVKNKVGFDFMVYKYLDFQIKLTMQQNVWLVSVPGIVYRCNFLFD